MKVTIQGRHVELSGLSREHITHRLEGVGKYVHGDVEVDVLLDHEGHVTRVEIGVRVGGVTVRAEARAETAARALDEAVDRVEVQLGRRKDRVKGHRSRGHVRDLLAGEPVNGDKR